MNHKICPYYVAVGNHDGPGFEGCPPEGPIVFEQYLHDCTLENARSRMRVIDKDNGGGRIALLDFDLGGSADEPHVVVTSSDISEAYRGRVEPRGPIVWETYINDGHATRGEANRLASKLERSYGACRIARLDFEEVPK